MSPVILINAFFRRRLALGLIRGSKPQPGIPLWTTFF
jgi:hypothetical protein